MSYYRLMPWTPPIERQKHRINEKEFFRLIAEQCNYQDERSVRDFYFALVRVVSQELRSKNCARLPGLGDFGLIEQKSRPAWLGKMHVRIGPRLVLKFYISEKMRRYFSARQGPHSIDPSGMGNSPHRW